MPAPPCTIYDLFAPAKVNLDLTITGRRADGYHTLRSRVAFADCGDALRLELAPSDTLSCDLEIDGPFAVALNGLAPHDNLAVRAVMAFAHTYNLSFAARIYLTKNIPSGAGLGGGSADAAAVLRGLVAHFAVDDKTDRFRDLCAILGADVPVCYAATPCVMTGIGDIITPVDIADTNAVLIWPGAGASTAALYAAYDAQTIKQSGLRNDFLPVALSFCPAIDSAMQWLSAQSECREVAMTGSGTAVFGQFDAPPPSLENAPFPWVRACVIGMPKKPLVIAQSVR